MSAPGNKCHWPGCPTTVAPDQWACAVHWPRIPVDYRKQIVTVFRPGMSLTAAYTRIEEKVLIWIQAYKDRTRA